MRFRRENSLAVVIDIQERLFPHIYGHEELAQNALRLISGLKALEVPFLLTQQYTKGLGPTIPAIRDELPETEPVEKISFSCCGSPVFMGLIEKLNPEVLFLFGIETHVCVLQTALDLQVGGRLTPVVVQDCTSSRKPNDKQVALSRLAAEGIRITTYESLLFELCRSADADAFKSISRIVK
ncbi:MAG TPA: isochorismatase family protein [Spirochaetia bacterium]|nr:isochorismatase family protein [Spirochaetia bacterium]